MSKKKSILLALITPIVLQACNSTSDYSSENKILQSNLIPMATYFKGNVFNRYYEEITHMYLI